MNKEEQVKAYEKKLLIALKENDITTVEDLIHDNLLFNIPTGQMELTRQGISLP